MRVTLEAIGHRFGDGPWLFRSIDHVMDDGALVAVTGPSGSGKSTLLAIIAGVLEPAEGTVSSTGSRVVWVPQNPHGVAARIARDHVALPLLARGLDPQEADAKADALLQRFGLAHRAHERFSSLSGGEAQRLMFARGVASAPDVLIVDEPTAQLDRRTAASIDAVIGDLAQSGTVTIVATHDAATRAACTSVLDLDLDT